MAGSKDEVGTKEDAKSSKENLAPSFAPFVATSLVVDAQRAHDRVERGLEVSFVLRSDGDHVEQLAIA